MIARRYTALSLIPLAMSLAGFAALGAPDPLRGPLIATEPFGPDGLLGLFTQPMYLADAIGLVLLALATLEIWILAITWEYRRHRHYKTDKR
ncbi:MAG TPA: hypothetical protein VI793_15275 [Anaerolineales bacterium]|nr:hypothetical protein [Anaerolineales bacterium]